MAVARLRHMIEAADMMIRYTARGREAFESDSALRDGILWCWNVWARWTAEPCGKTSRHVWPFAADRERRLMAPSGG